jgi:putative endonuclease
MIDSTVKRDDLTCLETLEPPSPVDGRAFVYILACSDAALYIGSTGDLRGRLDQHGGPKGAKSTRDHAGGRLVYYEGPFEFAVALQRERQLRRWSRAKKLALIQNQTLVLRRLSQSHVKRINNNLFFPLNACSCQAVQTTKWLPETEPAAARQRELPG